MLCDTTTQTWFDFLDSCIGIFQGLLTPIIGLIVVYVAYQQHLTNRNRLRLDLYDRRFKLYNEIQSFLASIAQRGDVSDHDLMDCLRNTKEAIFLFKEDISKYIDELYTQACDLQYLEKVTNNKVRGADREESVKKRAKVFGWLTNQSKECTEKFKKYLSFEKIQ